MESMPPDVARARRFAHEVDLAAIATARAAAASKARRPAAAAGTPTGQTYEDDKGAGGRLR